MDWNIKNSIQKFVDDIKVFGRVLNQSQCSKLQDDINNLVKCLKIGKCYSMLQSVKLCTLVIQICNTIIICATANSTWLLKSYWLIFILEFQDLNASQQCLQAISWSSQRNS